MKKSYLTLCILLPLSSCDPQDLEMLSINILKNLIESSVDTLSTPKVLSAIPEEDIIEVFI